MAWDRGRYFTRSRRISGRVVREYVGTGLAGEMASRLAARERAWRKLIAEELRQEKAKLTGLDTEMKALAKTTDLAVRAALLAAGLHQHKRGEWRKRREQDRPR